MGAASRTAWIGTGPGLDPRRLLVLVGRAVALLVWQLLALTGAAQPDDGRLSSSERARRALVREESFTYRYLEPAVQRLAGLNLRLWPERLGRLQNDFELLAESAPWRAEEFMACKQLESPPALLIGMGLGWLFFGGVMVPLVGAAAVIGYQELALGQVSRAADARRRRLRNRLPFAVELMALMVESGASAGQCLETLAQENRTHPLGEEFERVCASIRERGIEQSLALKTMAQRVQDPYLKELVDCLNTADRLGTPLKDSLRGLAEQMRLRGIQLHEKAAEEAKVHITWPAMLIMVACLLIVAAPFILAALGG